MGIGLDWLISIPVGIFWIFVIYKIFGEVLTGFIKNPIKFIFWLIVYTAPFWIVLILTDNVRSFFT